MSANAGQDVEYKNDEIDLVDLVQDLWKQRLIILGVMGLVGLAAVAYVQIATPYYQTQSVLKAASLKSFDQLNLTGVHEIDRDQVLKRIGGALESYSTRYAFFQENPGLFKAVERPGESLEQAFQQLNKTAFTILKPDLKKPDSLFNYVGLSFVYPQGVDGPAVVNGMISFATADVRERIASEINTLIANRLNKLQSKIVSARKGYETTKQSKVAELLEADSIMRANLNDELASVRQELILKRENRIKQLSEAIMIAEKLGIHKPATPSSMGDESHQSQGNTIRTEVNNQRIPLYFMGTEALSAEREALSLRESDDFTGERIGEIEMKLRMLKENRQVEALLKRDNDDLFLEKMAKWNEEISFLTELKPELLLQDLVIVDQPAIEPLAPIKPKKLLIVTLGLVLGAFLGGFIALVRVVMANTAASRTPR
ncbi:chain-length determining protein [Pseudomonas sp. J237]|nr:MULTISPECIES: Wzz/FepE/Etk N-terminal domain-containing protein [Pseudomonas]OEO23980.1 chain-length determining protein [Pseudomonas sp. J237]